MTQHDARIVLSHQHGRTWYACAFGRGSGDAWGCALAALDYHAHAWYEVDPPVFELDANAVRRLVAECTALGVRIGAGTWVER